MPVAPRWIIASLLLVPFVAFAQSVTPTQGATPTGTFTTVNASTGDQTDPHVSGDWAAYTNQPTAGVSEIRYYNFLTQADTGIPTNGGLDFLSDISGSLVAYTHLTSTSSSIYLVDVTDAGSPVELDPSSTANRAEAAIGGSTVAWQDNGFSAGQPEIVAFDLGSRMATRLTNDSTLDENPAVSPDGRVVSWTKCVNITSGCQVWTAINAGGIWTSRAVATQGESNLSDTNGTLVVYSSTRVINGASNTSIYWQPVAGGAEHQLIFPGESTNPTVDGNLIAFEHLDPTAAVPNWDIYLYDLASNTLYRITNSSVDETLEDVTTTPSGLVRVIWTAAETDYNVYAFSFQLPSANCTPEAEASTCQHPGERPLVASLTLIRDTSAPQAAQVSFTTTPGDGLFCVENGSGIDGDEATAGWVSLNGALLAPPDDFERSIAWIQSSVKLQSQNSVSARIAGKPGTSYTVNIYGVAPKCETGAQDDIATFDVHTNTLTVGSRAGAAPVTDATYPHPKAAITGGAMGCSASGMPGLLAIALVLLWLVPRRKAQPVRIRR